MVRLQQVLQSFPAPKHRQAQRGDSADGAASPAASFIILYEYSSNLLNNLNMLSVSFSKTLRFKKFQNMFAPKPANTFTSHISLLSSISRHSLSRTVTWNPAPSFWVLRGFKLQDPLKVQGRSVAGIPTRRMPIFCKMRRLTMGAKHISGRRLARLVLCQDLHGDCGPSKF